MTQKSAEPIKYDDEKYSAKFPFIRDDIALVAKIDPNTKRQHLVFEKTNPETHHIEFFNEMECFDTANTTRSGESLQQPIKLSLKDQWFAFKSMVQGIAEAGMDAFQLKSRIESMTRENIKIFQYLFRNMIRADPLWIPQYLNKIEKECRIEGANYKLSLRTNLDILLNAITKFFTKFFFCRFSVIKDDQFIDKLAKYLLDVAERDHEFLFQFISSRGVPNSILKDFISERKEFKKFPEFKVLFSQKDQTIEATKIETIPRVMRFRFTRSDTFLSVIVGRGKEEIDSKTEPKYVFVNAIKQLIFYEKDESDRYNEQWEYSILESNQYPQQRDYDILDSDLIPQGGDDYYSTLQSIIDTMFDKLCKEVKLIAEGGAEGLLLLTGERSPLFYNNIGTKTLFNDVDVELLRNLLIDDNALLPQWINAIERKYTSEDFVDKIKMRSTLEIFWRAFAMAGEDIRIKPYIQDIIRIMDMDSDLVFDLKCANQYVIKYMLYKYDEFAKYPRYNRDEIEGTLEMLLDVGSGEINYLDRDLFDGELSE